MFPLVSKVVKVALSFSHGNADVERGFSKSKLTLTKDKTRMDERTLNARLTIYDSTKGFKNNLHLLTIDQNLLLKGQNAHNSYKNYLEGEEKRRKEISEASKKEKIRIEQEKENLKQIQQITSNVKELEIELQNLQKQKNELKQSSDELMENANSQLLKAVNQNNLQSAHVARGMMSVVENMRKEEDAKEKEILKLTKKIDQKKSKVLNNLLQSRLSKSKNDCDKENVPNVSPSSQLDTKRKITTNKEKLATKTATNVKKTNKSKVPSTKPVATIKRKAVVKNTIVPEKKLKMNRNVTIDNFFKNNQEKEGVTFTPENSERVIKKQILMKDLL